MTDKKNWDFVFNPRILDDLLIEVKKDERLREYYSDCLKFVDYLKKCDKISIKYNYLDENFQYKTKIGDYYNRYTPKYRRKIYAKFKALERWTKENFRGWITLLTLTTYQKGFSISDCLERLQENKKILSYTLRNARKKIDFFEYLWVIEPHQSGYPHAHFILLTSIPLDEDFETQLREVWSKKLEVGDWEHGLKLGSDEREDNKSSKQIEFLAQYLFKYVGKSINIMTPAYLVYHSQIWKRYCPAAEHKGQAYQCTVEVLPDGSHKVISPGKGSYRLWGCTKKLSEIMKDEVIPTSDNYLIVSTVTADRQTKIYEKKNVELARNIFKRHRREAYDEIKI